MAMPKKTEIVRYMSSPNINLQGRLANYVVRVVEEVLQNVEDRCLRHYQFLQIFGGGAQENLLHLIMAHFVAGLLCCYEKLPRTQSYLSVFRFAQASKFAQGIGEFVRKTGLILTEMVDQFDHQMVLLQYVEVRKDLIQDWLCRTFMLLPKRGHTLVVVTVLKVGLNTKVPLEQLLQNEFHPATYAISVSASRT